MAIAPSMTLGQLTAILDSAIEGLIAVDPEGRIVLFNERAGEIMRAQPVGSALGRPVREVVPNSRLPDVLASGQDELNRRMEVGATTIVTSRRVVRGADGRIEGAVAIFRDIGEARRSPRRSGRCRTSTSWPRRSSAARRRPSRSPTRRATR